MLFWNNLTNSLQKWGFRVNTYDCCVTNKMVNGKYITIVWDVDDLKISHAGSEVVTEDIDLLKERNGRNHCPS